MGLRLDPEVLPFLRSLAPGPRKAVRSALQRLRDDPRDRRDLDVKALDLDQDTPNHYRLRVGDYRIVYTIQGPDAYVVRVFHRSDGYGWLERL